MGRGGTTQPSGGEEEGGNSERLMSDGSVATTSASEEDPSAKTSAKVDHLEKMSDYKSYVKVRYTTLLSML